MALIYLDTYSNEYNRGYANSTIENPVGPSHKECKNFIGGVISNNESNRFGGVALLKYENTNDDIVVV